MAAAVLLTACLTTATPAAPEPADPAVTACSTSTGPVQGGTEVVVSGTGMEKATGVSFGGVPSPYWRLDAPTGDGSRTLTAVSPPHASGMVPVTVAPGATCPAPFLYAEGAAWRPGAPLSDALGEAGARAGHTATRLADGTVLVVGGTGVDSGCIDPSCATATAARFYPGAATSGRWFRAADPGARRTEHTATLLDPPACHGPQPPAGYPCGAVLVAGGNTGDPYNAAPTAGAQLYHPATDTWTAVPPMAVPRSGHTATLLADGRILVAGGVVDGAFTPTASAELYDPRRGAWNQAAPMSTPRYLHTATALDPAGCGGPAPPALYPCGDVVVAGGWAGADFTTSVERYEATSGEGDDPAGRWVQEPGMPASGDGHTASLLHDGRILVVERRTAAVLSPADPAAGWLPAAEPPLPFAHHAAATLDDGSVLLAGGDQHIAGDGQPFSAPVASVARFTPSATGPGGWQLAGQLASGRLGHTVTLLAGGSVLVAGGRSGQPPAVSATTELYDGRQTAPPAPRLDAVDPPAGAQAGGPVTLTGAGLFPPAVRFGDQQAAVTFASDTEVVAVAPPGSAGAGVAVTVSTPWGVSAAGAYHYAAGRWSPVAAMDACAPPGSCAGRSSNVAVGLDPAACHGGAGPTPGYPCGSVLVAGPVARSLRARVAQSPEPAATALDGARFDATDVGRVLDVGGIRTRIIGVGGSGETAALADGVIAAGDRSALVEGSAAEMYDPAGRWSAAAAMEPDRADDAGGFGILLRLPSFTATLLDGPRCRPADGSAGYPCGDVLVTGGIRFDRAAPTGPLVAVGTSTLYHPATGGWTPGAVMVAEGGRGRTGHTATLLDRPDCHSAAPPADYPCGKVLVAGGYDDPGDSGTIFPPVLASAELYDPLKNSWQATADRAGHATHMGTARVGHTATLLPDGRVLITGGALDTAGPYSRMVRSSELFDPVSQTWRYTSTATGATTEMSRARLGHTATLLDPPACHAPAPPPAYPCRQVLVAGGLAGAGETDGRAAAELYDPATGGWSTVDWPLTRGRVGHTATLLPNGRVLLAGGADPVPTAAAELYDPVRRIFTPTVAMTVARFRHTASLLTSGQVLVTGGPCTVGTAEACPAPSAGPDTATAELYTPAPAVSAMEPGSGPSAGGTLATIEGTGFSLLGPGPSVTFDGAAGAAVEVESDTRLRVVAPAHPSGPVDVAVTGAAGSSAESPPDAAARFTYEVSRPPDAVTDLVAVALSESQVELRFSAPASDGGFPPPARRYRVKQAAAPITDQAAFDAAVPLCPDGCTLAPAAVGQGLTLLVGDLAPATTYHWALVAVNDAGMAGPLSNPTSAATSSPPGSTGGGTASCGEAATGPGRVLYPAGWSLVGIQPAGAASPLYGWNDQGAGGRYAVQDAAHPVALGHGYWAWFACPTAVTLPAGVQRPDAIALGAYHASLVGNPGPSPAVVSGYDYAARWDPGLAGGYRLSGYRQAEVLAPGQAMWVFAYRATTVTMKPAAGG